MPKKGTCFLLSETQLCFQLR